MKKIPIAERPGWQARVEREGFVFHTLDGERYWDERGYYQFSEAQVSRDLEAPTKELHEMCLDVVARVVDSEALLASLAIPPAFFDLVRRSWKEGQPHLYGRFDFSYDGHGPAKLLEANYDTPTSLLEAAAVQLLWLEDQIALGNLPARANQFNTLAEDLVRAFATFPSGAPFYFSAIAGSVEDRGTTDFLRRMARHAGIDARHIDLEAIGLAADGRFVDLQARPIERLFKLHAWEHIFLEPFGQAVATSGTQFVEPAWKAIISNKGILALLWQLHEGHPNLLPARVDPQPGRPVSPGWVRKPFFSREGANIEIHTHDHQRLSEGGPYTDAPYILQQCAPLPRFGDSYTVVGSWVVGDTPAGIGIREDDSLITKDSSRFLPHVVLD
ncbi:glutathionylspermidine synthase family protein [Pseudomonas typographi]|uniref:Glutathionylspermidine synthase family protein n=1 Tax=Pseudomonas typographi TaxID=2715964 RepID=A0ABR7Z1E3_9PSED|nr:glutathionylspermidine synthase family protein [Pseudomonas typographi]MBD1554614.1 glutathionylspermidine synthase family protein [Pseudomonas typographi]MBD1589731.1 glutathionylspermidine synthase family protein [Pseudomonas typographi]MBD1599208.1 glutathionylspermidine synthase family protein [Pseudomonas typographi]